MAAILMYHRVADLDPDVHRLCVPPKEFRAHMAELRRRHHPMTLTDLADMLTRGDSPAGAVAVTFDDGCLDNLTIGSEILQEFEIPATFFIATDRLEKKHEFWWDVLERVLIDAAMVPARLDLTADGATVYPTENIEQRAAAHGVLADRLRSLDPGDRDRLMSRIAAWGRLDPTPRDTHRPMVALELRELSGRREHAIGAHGVHHRSLPALPVEVQYREMFQSKKALEDLLGIKVTAFAYPYGHFDETTRNLAAGLFDVAVTAVGQAAAPGADRMLLPRIDAGRLSVPRFVEQLKSIL